MYFQMSILLSNVFNVVIQFLLVFFIDVAVQDL